MNTLQGKSSLITQLKNIIIELQVSSKYTEFTADELSALIVAREFLAEVIEGGLGNTNTDKAQYA